MCNLVIALSIAFCVFAAGCKTADGPNHTLASDGNFSIADKAKQALEILRAASPEAYEAALLFRDITLAPPRYSNQQLYQYQDQRILALFPDAAVDPFPDSYVSKANDSTAQDSIYASSVSVSKNPSTMNSVGDQYDKGAITGSNKGMINHFKAIELASNVAGNDWYRSDRGLAIGALMRLDASHPLKLSKSGRVAMDQQAQNVFEIFLKLVNGNTYRAVTLIGDLGHDDINYSTSRSSHIYGPGNLGGDVRVPQSIFDQFKFVNDRLNTLIPKNLMDMDGTYNYQMNAGFYMGCQIAKLSLEPVAINKVMLDKILDVAISNFFNGNIPQCLSSFLDAKSCKPANDSSSKMFVSFIGSALQQYKLDLASDLPALSGFAYKAITLDSRLNKTSSSSDVKDLFKAGYINPFSYQADDLPLPPGVSVAKNFSIPQGWDSARMQKAVAQLDARLMHIQYVMEQHKAGAKFGAQVCNAYKARLVEGLGLKEKPIERALFEMGFNQAGFTVEQVKARALYPQRIGKLGADDHALSAAVKSLNEILNTHQAWLDYPSPQSANLIDGLIIKYPTH